MSDKNAQNAQNTMIIENVAHVDHDYVYTQQRVSYNGGVDFEIAAEWKHNRDAHHLQMANEWVSTPPQRIPFVERIPKGCGKIEL